MKAHKPDMIAAWARDAGIKGYEHFDPKVQAKRRQEALAKHNNRRREEYNKDSYQQKR